MSDLIEDLPVYKQAREAEDVIYEVVKGLPADSFYTLGNDLRRSSAAVSHYIMEAHRFFSYRLKRDAIASARRETATTRVCLYKARSQGYMLLDDHELLVATYTAIEHDLEDTQKSLVAQLKERQDRADAA